VTISIGFVEVLLPSKPSEIGRFLNERWYPIGYRFDIRCDTKG